MAVKAKRRLTDLYVVGEFLEFDDPDGQEPIRVFVRKLSPVEHEKALSRANAARSKIKALTNGADEDNDAYETIVSEAMDLTRDELTAYLVEDHRNARYPILDAELSAEEEWSEENYLEGLRESWVEGLADVYAEDPENPEAKKVHDELTRYADALDALVEGEMEAHRRDLEQLDDDKLRRRVIEKFLDVRASVAWINEFRRTELWLAVREEDKKTPYFTSRDEVDELSSTVFNRLAIKYRELTLEPVEGKG